jgi:hypothetical protein
VLPEFPRAQQAIQKVWNKLLFKAAGFSDPLISDVPIRVQKEGHRAFWGDSEIEYKPARVSCQWKLEDGKGIPTEDYFEMSEKLGREMAEQQAKRMFEILDTPTPRSAFLDRDEGPITFDLWATKMESVEVDFDAAGIPQWPRWYLAPDVVGEFEAAMKNLTIEQQARLHQLVDTKRKEFNERTARRRLVE